MISYLPSFPVCWLRLNLVFPPCQVGPAPCPTGISSTPLAWEGLFNSLSTVLQQHCLISFHVRQGLNSTAGPAGGHSLDHRSRPDAEMEAWIARTQVTVSGESLCRPSALRSLQGYFHSNPVSVLVFTNEGEAQPVISVGRVVAYEPGRSIGLINQHVHVSVVVIVSNGQTAPRAGSIPSWVSISHFVKHSRAAIVVDQGALFVSASTGEAISFWVDVAVGHNQIEPTVVVVIYKLGSPAKK